MTRIFERQEFHSVYDDGGSLFEDYEFRRCRFASCALSITRDPRWRSTIRNVKLIDCEENACGLESAIVEDTLIDGLKTSDLFQTWSAVFRHVTLRGKIGRIMLSPAVAPGVDGLAPKAQQAAFDEANQRYYAAVDWALDIREAEFAEATIDCVPGRLVRRDPATQVLVTRERALRGEWRQLDLAKTYWPMALDDFVNYSAQDAIVLVAPKRAKRFRQLLDGLERLREAGVAEPD